jgi:hypothetical protein
MPSLASPHFCSRHFGKQIPLSILSSPFTSLQPFGQADSIVFTLAARCSWQFCPSLSDAVGPCIHGVTSPLPNHHHLLLFVGHDATLQQSFGGQRAVTLKYNKFAKFLVFPLVALYVVFL